MYQKNTYKTLILLIATYFYSILTIHTQSYHFHQYTIQDGLPTNSIYGTMQDQEGYLWVFTEKGISKFDGYEFKTFTMEDGLPSNDVWDLTEDSKGRIWVHTISSQLTYIYQDSVYAIKTSGDITLRFALIHETEATIWFLNGDNKIYEIVGDSLEKIDYTAFRNTLGSVKRPFYYQEELALFTIYINPKKVLLLTEKKAYYFDNTGQLLQSKAYNDAAWMNKIVFDNSSPTPKKHFNRLEYEHINNQFTFYFTEYGIGKLNRLNFQGNSLSFREVFDDNQGTVAIAVPDKNGFQCTIHPSPNFLTIDSDLQVTDQFSLSDFSFRRIFKDQESNLWVATETEGLFLLTANARNARTFAPNKDKRVLSVTGDLNGNIFWSTTQGNIYQLKDNSSQQIVENDGLAINAKSLLLDGLGHLYAGMDNNAIQINIDKKTQQPVPKSILNDLGLELSATLKRRQAFNLNSVIRNVKDYGWDRQQKVLWISTGMDFFKVDFSTSPGKVKMLGNLRRINAIAIGENRTTWLGSSKGLLQLNQKEELIKEYEKHPLLKQKIIDVTTDQNNRLWLGTEGLGAYGYDGQNIIPIPATKGIIVSSLFIDYEGFLWVTSNKGVQKIYIHPDIPTNNSLVKHYTTNDGLASNETNAIFVDSNYLYIGTNQGLTRIDKLAKYQDESLPNLKIEKIVINDVVQPLNTTYNLNHSENTLFIEFAALSYKSFGAIQYEYQLNNVDEDWQITTNRNVRYTNLSPGNYQFQLKATDISGRQQIMETPITFSILPPFWQTLWFRLLAFLFIISSLFAGYKWRIKQIQQKAIIQAEINQKFAELELQALRSQMNPHFVFNALAAIQYFIQEKNIKEADNYLANFGELMRLFLESTKTKFISLENELKLLRLYIELEQIRFEDKFDTKITIDTNLDLFNLQIPTLLLQPYVENAINHGLFHKKGKGHLEMNFTLTDDDGLQITITDDGIGRTAAQKIRKSSIKSYKSRGLQIVEERISVLQNSLNLDIHIETIDLLDKTGMGIGTKVVIQIKE